MQATNGNFYGTTEQGGTGNCAGGGCGTRFKITPSGTLTTLYTFGGYPTDGALPSGLVQATDGNFYGTTAYGGASDYGTVFRMTTAGTLTTLYNFCSQPNCTDGSRPYAALVQATDGNFYGTTQNGGADGLGTVFKFQVPYYTLYTLTVTTNGDGVVTSTDGFINCPGTCSHSYPAQTQVTLTATPVSGWAFTGWGGACSGTGSCQVTITQNTNVSATFYQVAATLTVSVAGDGTVTSNDGYINCPGNCSHTYLPNTPVTLNDVTCAGLEFRRLEQRLQRGRQLQHRHDWETGGQRILPGAWVRDTVHSGHALPPGRHAPNPRSDSGRHVAELHICRSSAAATYPPAPLPTP